MKGSIWFVLLVVVAGLVFFLNVGSAPASSMPVVVVDNVFTALNSGRLDDAAAAFAEDAVAENLVQQDYFQGLNEIREMLAGMAHPGREFNIVSSEMSGNVITAAVEVSDRGNTWGTETIEAVVQDGKLLRFTVKAFRLELWKIGR